MKCIPKEIFMPQEYLGDLVCPLGGGILRNPVALPCQHVFCKGCIEEFLKSNPNCPSCSIPCSADQIKAGIEVAELINQASAKCVQCGWEGPYQQLEKHSNSSCPKNFSQCPHGCGIVLQRSQMAEHEASCKYKKFQCKHCSKDFMLKEMEVHIEGCSEKPVDCPQKCGKSMKLKDLESHLKSECKNPKSVCKFSFAGCYFAGAGGSKEEIEAGLTSHYSTSIEKHLDLLCQIAGKMSDKVTLMEEEAIEEKKQKAALPQPPNYFGTLPGPHTMNATTTSWNSPPFGGAVGTGFGSSMYGPSAMAMSNPLDVKWSNNLKTVNGSKVGSWSCFLSRDMILAKNFQIKVRINKISPSDSNTWKICIGLFKSNKMQPGSWEKYKNAYGYVMGTGQKVHEGSPMAYGASYALNDILTVEYLHGNISFHKNGQTQGSAFSGIEGPFYLGIAISDVNHQVEIVDASELK